MSSTQIDDINNRYANNNNQNEERVPIVKPKCIAENKDGTPCNNFAAKKKANWKLHSGYCILHLKRILKYESKEIQELYPDVDLNYASSEEE